MPSKEQGKGNKEPEDVSSTLIKVEITKDVYLQMWKVFDIWSKL